MAKVFKTKLEDAILAWNSDTDMGPLLVDFWNNQEKYDITKVEDGCLILGL